MNIVLVSHTRTCSTWLKHLILYVTRYRYERFFSWEEIESKNPNEGKGVLYKSHIEQRNVIGNLFKLYPPENYKVVSIVRNPRDRHLSVHKFRKGGVPLDDRGLGVYEDQSNKQLRRMMANYSTHRPFENRKYPYVWTAYEWMAFDSLIELSLIFDFLEISVTDDEILEAITFWHKRNVSYERDLERLGTTTYKYDNRNPENWIQKFPKNLLDKTDKQYRNYKGRLKNERAISN